MDDSQEKKPFKAEQGHSLKSKPKGNHLLENARQECETTNGYLTLDKKSWHYLQYYL
jgi:hypothetical protein